MKKEPKFIWDDTTGEASCILTDGKHFFTGTAKCSEIDADMKNQNTGSQIALYRAEIKYYLHLRDNEIKPALEALRHTYSTMVNSKKFNINSYESKSLRREIYHKEFDLSVIVTMLNDKKTALKEYLSQKENLYKKIREGRKDKNA